MDKYQQQPHLLDPHLGAALQGVGCAQRSWRGPGSCTLESAALSVSGNETSPQDPGARDLGFCDSVKARLWA
ncbi:hypothetical protein MDA_GLEAN10010232 [Myotis davidii]|uniref:Uncharacterized protein n=1 Tax=Myotis davidii TaxID=225400 RepID=L5MKR5_MYODS|nr:hypothetical protein MDA_GLEAN10010232 [Myotis davidii]